MDIGIPESGKSRADYAVSLFQSGYNCAQSVFAAYADLFGMDQGTALKMSSAMGGGVGRMRDLRRGIGNGDAGRAERGKRRSGE
jgi:hypothetical protein